MKPDAVIICHTRSTGLGAAPQITYKWKGGDVIRISCRLMQDASYGMLSTRNPQPGETFWLGPFQLRALEYNFEADDLIACRERPIKAQLFYALYRSTRLLDRAYRRAIITLAVWGLATYRMGRIPSWHDVKGLDWLVRWDNRRRDKAMVARIKRLNDLFRGK